MAEKIDIPPTVRAFVAPKPCSPDQYEIQELPTPTITKPGDVLMKMKAATVNTGDTQFAAGAMNFIKKQTYPMRLGMEGSGIVVAVGSGVKNLKVGDEVYGFTFEKPFPKNLNIQAGFISDYAVCEERFLLSKPPQVSFEDAAALPGMVITAYQVIRRALQLHGTDSLAGKKVYIPAALSSTGTAMIQVARNYFGATHIVSSVSTVKMPLVKDLLPPGTVDQVVDYQKGDVVKEVGRGTVDVAISTQWATLDESIAVLKPQTGTLMSIASIPTKQTLKSILGFMPLWVGLLLDVAQLWYAWKLRGTAIKYEFLSGGPEVREEMELMGEIIARGQVKAVTTVLDFGDLDEMRKAAEKVKNGKGGIGKLVIRIS